MTVRKVGGIWFARVGRVQLSLCICKPKAAPRKAWNASSVLFLDGITAALCAGILAHVMGG